MLSLEKRRTLEVHPGARPVFYCNIGNLACVNFVAALVARFIPIIYDGSMEEWGSRFDLPVEEEYVGEKSEVIRQSNKSSYF